MARIVLSLVSIAAAVLVAASPARAQVTAELDDCARGADVLLKTVLELDQRDPGSIAKAFTSVLTDPGSAAAARDLAGLFAAMPHPGELVPVIENLA